MKVRASDIAAALAPTVKRGAPADVIDAINTLAQALVAGTTPPSSALRWPEPAVRALLLDALAARDDGALVDRTDARILPVLQRMIEAIDAVEVMRDRMRAGHQQALANGHAVAEGVDSQGVDAMWTRLALVSLRASLSATLDGSEARREPPSASASARWTLDRSAPALMAAQALWRQATASASMFAMQERLARSRDRAPLAPAQTAAREAGRSTREARIRARAAHVRRAFASVVATPISELPSRVGPLWIVLDRPRQREPEAHALWRSAVVLVASAGLVSGRELKLVFTDHGERSEAGAELEGAATSVLDLRSDDTFEALLPLLDHALVRRPSDAMAWVRANVRGPLDRETDVVIVTCAKSDRFESEAAEVAQVSLSEAQREAGVRLHLVRPGHDVDFPCATAFDAFHFVSVPAVEV